MAEMTYLQAISDGLRQEMRRDKRVFVIGEDVGVYGGAFKVTLGFQEEFGPWRVIDAPLSETAIVGGCTGAAIMGMRPVAEMQFADFISCAWDQLVTVAAKQFYRAGTPVPIVVRLPSGGGFSGGPFHSQNPESSFAHIAGLKVVCPATPEDAKGLLISAIEDPNPVLYFEHKHLYRRIKGRGAGGAGVRVAAQHRHEREAQDRRGRAIGHYRRGAFQVSGAGYQAEDRLHPARRRRGPHRRRRPGGSPREEGLDIELVREVSWSNVRDKLNIGLFDAAHLIAPIAVASNLGSGTSRCRWLRRSGSASTATPSP